MKTSIYKLIMFLWKINPLKTASSKIIHSLNLPIGKLKRDLWFNGVFRINYFDKIFFLKADKQDKSSLSIFWDGLENSWDAESINIWGKLALKSDTIFDIGSNIGLYAIAAKTINPNAQIYAFEPSRKIISRLKENIELNQLEINLSTIALSNFEGEIDFYDLDSPTAVASLKFNENLKNNDQLITYKVKVDTFKNFVKQNNIQKIDLISIDVEMNEPEVLQGMGDLIKLFRPNFIIEVLNNEVGIEIQKHFEGLDYLYFEIIENKGLKLCSNLSRESNHIDHSFNFLICDYKSATELKLI